MRLALFLLCGLAFAQQRTIGTLEVFAVPSGVCAANSPVRYYAPATTPYGCTLASITSLTGTWAAMGGGGGTVNSVGFSSNFGTVMGSPVTTSGTLAFSAAAADIVGLFSTCSGVQYLGADGACHTPAAGTVTTTGSPVSGNLTKFSGASSITNGDLSGDVTTAGTLATTIANGVVTNAKLANSSATINGATCTLGSSCTVSPFSGGGTPGIGAYFDGGGGSLDTSLVAYITTTGACTLSTGYYISGVDAGTISFDVWKISGTGTANPTVANTILTGGYLALSTGGRLIQSSSALFSSTAVSANDTLAIAVHAVTSATKASIVLPCS